jgi:peroxiredoxin
VPESEKSSLAAEAAPNELPPELAAAEAQAQAQAGDFRIVPEFQPMRAILSLALVAGGFAIYLYVLRAFWASPDMGIHDQVPYPAYLGMALALILCLAGTRLALGIWSPHAKLGLSILGLFACVVVGVSGGRFVSYTIRGTLNPPFKLNLKLGDRFPAYSLADQNGAVRGGPPAGATLVMIYRGDFCPFARYELSELTAHKAEFDRARVGVVAISADPGDRAKMLAGFLRTDIPLLSDDKESVLGPLGLVQHHRDGEPDSAIPAFFMLDRDGVVRWIFTSPYYREMPSMRTLLDAAASVQQR